MNKRIEGEVIDCLERTEVYQKVSGLILDVKGVPVLNVEKEMLRW